MKMLTLAFLALCLGLHATAQPPPGRDRGERANRPPAVDRWMAQLQDEHPEEFHRLQRMRSEDPEAFAAHLRGRVHDVRMLERIHEEFPEVGDLLRRMTPEEREELGRMLRPPPQRGPHAGRRGHEDAGRAGPPPGRGKPDLQRLREQVRDWNMASTPEAKERIRNEIRTEAERLFDERSAMHLEEVKRIEEQLQQLRAMIQERDARRTEWIDQLINNALAKP